MSTEPRARVPNPGESVLVKRLLSLGAAAFGKTHLHEIAIGFTGMNGYGGTTHPTLPECIAGGSSSGAAVSVALGQVDFALGTDTGGSLRVPAAWCGVVGYKPTKGHPVWSTEGVLPLSWTCDHAGLLAADIHTVVRIHEALDGGTIQRQSWMGLNVGLWMPAGWVDTTVENAVNALISKLQGRGARVSTLAFPDVSDAYLPIVLSEAAKVHQEALHLEEPGFLPPTLEALRQGQALTTTEVRIAFERRAEYRTLLEDVFRVWDVIVAPAVPTLPPQIGQDQVEIGEGRRPLLQAVLRLNAPFSLLGVPTVALSTNEPYVGVQMVMPRGQDNRLLGLALAESGS